MLVTAHMHFKRKVQKKVPILRLKKKLIGQDDVDATFERQVTVDLYVLIVTHCYVLMAYYSVTVCANNLLFYLCIC